MINPPFYCDYGTHISVGKNFFANYNCTIIDVAKVTIGDNCQFAPNVSIYTAGHPIHPAVRNTLYEYGISVTVGDNVWIGGNSVWPRAIPAGSSAKSPRPTGSSTTRTAALTPSPGRISAACWAEHITDKKHWDGADCTGDAASALFFAGPREAVPAHGRDRRRCRPCTWRRDPPWSGRLRR